MSDSGGDNNKVPTIVLWAPKGQMYQIYGKLNQCLFFWCLSF